MGHERHGEGLPQSEVGGSDAAASLFGRFGQPSDLDGPFLLLASNADRHMTGATIKVGGLMGPLIDVLVMWWQRQLLAQSSGSDIIGSAQFTRA